MSRYQLNLVIETVTLSPIGPSTSELTSVPGGLKFCKDTFCFLLSASPIGKNLN